MPSGAWIERNGMSTDVEKMVSIVIPVYQAKNTLKKCVDSCISQKGIDEKQLEIILVDDGSTDGSGLLCDELAEDYSNSVKTFHTENQGVSLARNLGIEKASGKYICFVDSDDYVSDSFVENLLINTEEKAVIVDETDSHLANLWLSGYQYIENSILNRNTHVWGKLFLLEEIKENNITFKEGLTIGEDLLFLMDLALLHGKKQTIKCIASNGYTYVDNPEGAMKKSFKESYMDELVCWKEAEEKLLGVREYISNYSFVSVAVSQIETALLVIGKLACVDKSERSADLEQRVILRVKEQVKHALKTRGAFAALEPGHKIKVMLLKLSPEFYLNMYGKYKK